MVSRCVCLFVVGLTVSPEVMIVVAGVRDDGTDMEVALPGHVVELSVSVCEAGEAVR